MRRSQVMSVFALTVAVTCWYAPVTLGDDKESSLLTGQDASGQLPGWEFYAEKEGTKIDDVWTLHDGVLTCQGTPKGYLYTSNDYKNFVLTLEWRWAPEKKPGNGGVLIRMTGAHKIWPKSLEAQINAGQAGDFWGLDGYGLEGPAERSKAVEHAEFGKLINVQKLKEVEKPAGEWNQYEITAEEGTVTLRINGQQVNQATRCDVVAGKICLTAEGDAIQFRNVRLTTK
ncbi:MAG: 3-keto-disaccharide hydrolase [Pirellulaceae bacterium]